MIGMEKLYTENRSIGLQHLHGAYNMPSIHNASSATQKTSHDTQENNSQGNTHSLNLTY